MLTIHDFDISEDALNDANEWRHMAYAWDEQGDYEKAVFCMTKAAALGDVVACAYLGDYYENGQGIAQNYAKAAELYAGVAACREPLCSDDYLLQSQAAYRLGVYHEQGLLPDASPEQAAKWYHQALDDATNAFYAKPAIALARLYLDGRGVEQNNQKAFGLVYDALHHRLDYAVVRQSFPLFIRLLACEEITADQEKLLFLLDQLSRMCDEGYGGAPDPDRAQMYRKQAEKIRTTNPNKPEPIHLPPLIDGKDAF